jgi:hypothetical protein
LIKRLACVVTAALALSSCAVGVRAPATNITETTATWNGKAVTTTGAPGEYFFVGGTALPWLRPAVVEDIEFGTASELPVSVPVDQLEPGTTYTYRACAGDNESSLCSPAQTFTTLGTPVPTFRAVNRGECGGPNDFGVTAFVVNYEPDTNYGFRADLLEGATGFANVPVRTDEYGNADLGSVGLTEPTRARVRLWLNPDDDVTIDPGEEVVLDQVYVVDEPCTDAQPETDT